MSKKVLELRDVTKLSPGVVALDDVTIGFKPGRVHAIVGENGAGKSTFIKAITGAIEPTEGTLIFDGMVQENNSPDRSLSQGIAAVYQEFSLVPYLTVAENIFLGRWPTKNGMVDHARMNREAAEVLNDLGVELHPRATAESLSVAYQQLVEIARAVSRDLRVLIMDEPSAPLTEREMDQLYRIVRRMRDDGTAVIYISHRLEEIFEVCDTVSVLRDGQHAATMPVEDTTEDHLVELMVDRPLDRVFPAPLPATGESVGTLRVEGLNTDYLTDVSFEAEGGKILGLAGLVGAGRTEVARALFGADPVKSGSVTLNGKEIKIRDPQTAVDQGVGLIPEDRKDQGLLLNMSVSENIVFASMEKITSKGTLRKKRENEYSAEYIDAMNIRTPSPKTIVEGLSGGNQQKVVLAKWLMTDSKVLILDEPTRGIDVGAKQEIYDLMRQLAAQGMAIIMISSELPELMGMSDEIAVMHDGKVVAHMGADEATPEMIIGLASGLDNKSGSQTKEIGS